MRGLRGLCRLCGLQGIRGFPPPAALALALNPLPACVAAKFAGKPGFQGQDPLHAPSDGLHRFSVEGFHLLFKALSHRHKASAVTIFVSQKNQFPFGDGLVVGQSQVPVIFHKVRHERQVQMAKESACRNLMAFFALADIVHQPSGQGKIRVKGRAKI